MAELLNGSGSLDVTDANNTTRQPEGQTPGSVNNGIRALEGMIARYLKDSNGSLTIAGTDTYTVTINADNGAALYDGMIIAGEVTNANTGAATLNPTPDGGTALGAQSIVKYGGTALAAGDIAAGMKALFIYNASSTDWHLMNPVGVEHLSNVVEDTTPQLGGNLDVNGNGIAFTGATVTDVTGADTLLVSGTAGASGNLAQWNVDGDLVDSGSTGTTAASQAEQETGTSTTVMVTPGRQQFHVSAAKFWIKFNGTGTPAVAANYNCASILDNGTGDYSLTIGTDFSSANYCTVASSRGVSAGSIRGAQTAIESQAVGSVNVLVGREDTGAQGDTTIICVAGYGDQ